MLIVAVHVYWSASEVLTGSKVTVPLTPDMSLDSVHLEELVHWMVGGEARRGTTLTEQVSVSKSPARTGDESSVVIVATGGGRPEMGGEGV